MAYLNFNAQSVPTQEYVENPGDYVARIISTDVTAPNGNGTQFLVLTWETDNKLLITSRYTVVCNNKTAENIGLGFLKRLAHGVFGIETFTDTNTLLDRPYHMIHVEKRPRQMNDGTTKEYCEVTKVEKIANAPAPSYSPMSNGQEPFPPTNTNRPAWAN
jgi:hypothetical protein